MRIKTILLLVLAVLACREAKAQGAVGSPYSRYGVGDVSYTTSARSQAMGGVGYATTYLNDANFKNPANLADMDTLTFIFNVGVDAGLRNYKVSNPSSSQTKADAQITQMTFGFSCTKWWKSALIFMPFSNVGYSIYSHDNTFSGKNYVFAGDGGVSKIMWSNGFKITKDLSIGISASYLFGKLYHSSAIIFENDTVNSNNTGSYVNSFNQNTYRVTDFTFDAGIRYRIPINEDGFILGAYYAYNKDLKTFRTNVVYNSLVTSPTSVVDTLYMNADQKGRISLPHTFGFGLGYAMSDKLYIGADFSMQEWSQAEFFGVKDSLNNCFFTSLGAEYIPAKSTARNIWQATAYRCGVYYNINSLGVNGSAVSVPDYGIAFGIGLPMKYSRTSLNITLQVGQRGSLKNDLIKETYFVAGLNFTLLDTWFIKHRID